MCVAGLCAIFLCLAFIALGAQVCMSEGVCVLVPRDVVPACLTAAAVAMLTERKLILFAVGSHDHICFLRFLCVLLCSHKSGLK